MIRYLPWRYRLGITFLWYDARKTVRALVTRLLRPHIHEPGDGRGMRYVRLDGELVDRVTYADLRRGFIRQTYSPARVNRRKDGIRWRKRYGDIRIVRGP